MKVPLLRALAIAWLAGAARLESAAPAELQGPKLILQQEEYDFGTIAVGATGKHAFTLGNAGTQPLTLARARTTCGCCTCVCTVRLPEGEAVGPGKSAAVTLEWLSKLYTGAFRQSATLTTNDPARPEVTLRVAGRFVTAVRAVPSDLVFSQVLADRPATGEVRLYGYTPEPLKVTEWKLADSATAPYFDVAVEPLAPDQLREEPGAQSGVRLRATVKPGLPAGLFRQRLLVATNSKLAPTLEIPITGAVRGDLSIVGRGWDDQRGRLSMGAVSRRTGGAQTLRLVVRGPHAKQVAFHVARVVPEWLAADLGTTTPLGEAASQTPLTIRIPPGRPAPSGPGSGQEEAGRVVLKSSHPTLPELEILVFFTLEP